jgi:glyoxylate reductase
MLKPKVYVSRIVPEEGLTSLRDFAEVNIWQNKESMPRELQFKLFEHCDGLLSTLNIAVDAELLKACPSIKVVSNYGVGYDNIDVAACTALGVAVGNTPGVLSETTADHAFALILATARRIAELADWVKNNNWTPEMGYLDKLGTDVHHTTLGILGMGRIGAEVARRAVGFNMRILYHNRSRNLNHESEFGAVHVSKKDLLKQSDFVSINLPQSQETLHYIGSEELRLMKSSAILINTSRGPLVDQAALLEALKSGQIAGAGLDVTDPEPIRGDNPLLALPQVTVLPHVGSATWQTRTKMAEVAARNLINALSGKPMVSCVNPQALGQGRYAEMSA